ncbi:hypothetical protein EPO44_14895 [bacterium]|nr:MAG: hypothetical protein EPO44_14895 [bacterium]
MKGYYVKERTLARGKKVSMGIDVQKESWQEFWGNSGDILLISSLGKPGPPGKREYLKISIVSVCRGSGATCRLKSGAGNYRFTPLAKIRF